MSRFGLYRSRYQVFPSGLKVTCVEINDSGQCDGEWFERSLKTWVQSHSISRDVDIPILPLSDEKELWDFVLVVPFKTVRNCWQSNDGMQAWRDQKTGYVIPDHCRQMGGRPEMWSIEDIRRKKELQIINCSQIEQYVVVDLPARDLSRSRQAFLQNQTLISFLQSDG